MLVVFYEIMEFMFKDRIYLFFRYIVFFGNIIIFFLNRVELVLM